MLNFDKEKHEYTLDGKPLISVTQLLKKHGLAPDYSGIDEETLAKKAKRGTLIHKEIEEYVKEGTIGFTEELQQFIELSKYITWDYSEQMVNNDIVAGTIDLIGEEDGKVVIADIKTGVRIEYDSVRWQLSFYSYLYGAGAKFYVFHLCDEPELKEIRPVPSEEIAALLECERNGEIYKPLPTISENLLAQVEQIESIIAERKARLAEAEADEAEMKTALIKAMKESGVKSFDGGNIKITYIPEQTRESVDTKLLKTLHPQIAEECKKTTTVAETVRITLR